MGLIHTAYRERTVYFPVHATAGSFIFIIKGASMLIYHDPVFPQRIVAAAVKLLCKQTFCMSKWVCRVIDDQVITAFLSTKETQSVVIIYMDPLFV